MLQDALPSLASSPLVALPVKLSTIGSGGCVLTRFLDGVGLLQNTKIAARRVLRRFTP